MIECSPLLIHDFNRVMQVYDELPAEKRLTGIRNSQNFLPKFVGVFDTGLWHFSDYVNRETHYALSNAGYVFSDNQFQGINTEQYLRVRDKILEGVVHQEMHAIYMGGKAWWASMMTGLNWVFGETSEERNKNVRDIVNLAAA